MKTNTTISPVQILLFYIVLCNGLQSAAQTISSPLIGSDPVQYGKPFKGVPNRTDVTMYQVNIRVFSKEGNLRGVLSRLDSIKALGINVVYLMPIYPVGIIKSVNSPYCVRDYTAVNNEFGTLEDLRVLVRAAHQLNMAVILDWVPNHTSFDNAWIKNKSWYLQDSAGNIINPPHTGWKDVAQLNYNNHEMRLAMISAMKYWILTANIDGFRCDYADGPPVDFWRCAIDTLRHIAGHRLLMMAEGARSENYAAGFDYNFGFRFFENMKKIFNHNASARSIDSINKNDDKGTAGGQQVIRYISNHDVNGSDGTPAELFGGEQGSIAAFVIVAFMYGIPMLYNGQEVGIPYRLRFPFTDKKIDWAAHSEVDRTYKKLIGFRNASEAIRKGNLVSYTTEDVCAFTKKWGKQEVFVVSNLRNQTIDFTIPSIIKNTKWINALQGGILHLASSITLPPYSWMVLKR